MGRRQPTYFITTPRSLAIGLMVFATLTPPSALMAAVEAEAGPKAEWVQKLAESARKSVVIITYTGRDGKREGLGTGFIVGADGLIATNLHVIGEGRPIAVQLDDGKRYDVTHIHATDRAADLALVRIAAEGLPTLELGDSDTLKQGQSIVALGNPHGLTHSVVAGVVSGKPEIGGRPMIQLAIPIEPGNSGGPLLDLRGRVHGLLTMKSLVTANLGFAVPVNRLKPLLERPNPVPMERWLLIGTLSSEQWTPLFGARWRGRAGKIVVEGMGAGFGGRSLCLSRQAVPPAPYELAVTVKLDDESGAAGLAFDGDGGDMHYGFYASGGKLRLSRFDGPDVTSWQVLRDEASPHYHAGDWNTLKVRVESDKVLCYVNDRLAVESNQVRAGTGRAGLVKFRATRAEFKRFRLAKEIPSGQPADDVVARVEKLVADIPPSGPLASELIDQLAPEAASGMLVLRERAKRLERQAAQLRRLASVVYQRRVLEELRAALGRPDEKPQREIDLFHAALLLARLDNDELDVDAYLREFDRMADELRGKLPPDADEPARLAALNDYMFAANGFHGSRADYYNRANSYVNEVLDDREGLPITLSLVYMEFARRIGLNVVGIGLPGHFVVMHMPAAGEGQAAGEGPAAGEGQLIDVFEAGQPMTRRQADQIARAATGRPLDDLGLRPVDKRAILVRMLHNLRGIAGRGEDVPGMLRYLDAALAIEPDSAEDRMYRAFFRFQTGEGRGALEDIDWLVAHEPDGIDLGRVGELRALIERQLSRE
ncbi:MAG TPA: tetratricopeptide repeat protein [Pirellulales bacterium]|nr:tetratricopeptide repeat protein [Pirellulales bacterium]